MDDDGRCSQPNSANIKRSCGKINPVAEKTRASSSPPSWRLDSRPSSPWPTPLRPLINPKKARPGRGNRRPRRRRSGPRRRAQWRKATLRARSAFSLLLNDPAWMTGPLACAFGLPRAGWSLWPEVPVARPLSRSLASQAAPDRLEQPAPLGAASFHGKFHGKAKFSGFSGRQRAAHRRCCPRRLPFDDFPLAANCTQLWLARYLRS